jgi:hypothetical protein
MNTPTYKVVTKVNVTLQIEVQPADRYSSLDDVNKSATNEALEIVSLMVREYRLKGASNIAICGDPSVVSILVRDAKQ